MSNCRSEDVPCRKRDILKKESSASHGHGGDCRCGNGKTVFATLWEEGGRFCLFFFLVVFCFDGCGVRRDVSGQSKIVWSVSRACKDPLFWINIRGKQPRFEGISRTTEKVAASFEMKPAATPAKPTSCTVVVYQETHNLLWSK